jgi:hypothetical protein
MGRPGGVLNLIHDAIIAHTEGELPLVVPHEGLAEAGMLSQGFYFPENPLEEPAVGSVELCEITLSLA